MGHERLIIQYSGPEMLTSTSCRAFQSVPPPIGYNLFIALTITPLLPESKISDAEEFQYHQSASQSAGQRKISTFLPASSFVLPCLALALLAAPCLLPCRPASAGTTDMMYID
jgi:hypothetical protein